MSEENGSTRDDELRSSIDNDETRGYTLGDGEIEARIEQHKLIVPAGYKERKQVQFSSLDTTIRNMIYQLPCDARRSVITKGRVLSELMKISKPIDISKGYELKKTFTYIAPLNEIVTLEGLTSIKASPKSSLGRLFVNTRMISDFNLYLDEIQGSQVSGEDEINLYLMITPLAFNIIIHPYDSLLQIRFVDGPDSKVSEREIVRSCKKNPLLYGKETKTDGLIPIDPIISDGGIQLHLDAKGKFNKNLVGLRTKDNPDPIDLTKIRHYEPLEYYEPMIYGEHPLTIWSGDNVLLSSIEIVKIPRYWSGEFRAYSQSGADAIEHRAGFFDPGFFACAVGERTSNEPKEVELVHGSTLSKLDLFRTRTPRTLYGSGNSGSNYQGQIGPTPPKFFKPLLV